MPRHRSAPPSAQLVAIGEHATALIIAEMEAAGLVVDWQVYGPLIGPMGLIAQALERASLARRAAKMAARDEQRAAWAIDADAVSWEALQALWGLSQAEMHAASDLGLVNEIIVPWNLREAFSTPRYYRAVTLTEEQRKQIAATTLLSRTDAAARLGITPAAFDRLRKTYGIERADTTPTRAGNMLFLYRQTDVDSLASAAAALPRPAPAQPTKE